MNGQNLNKCSNFGGIPPLTSELAALEGASEKPIYKLVSTLAPSFCKLVGSSSFLQVPKTTIQSRSSLKFCRIQPWTAELAVLDLFINLLLENCSKYFDDLLSGERSLPFWLLVYFVETFVTQLPRIQEDLLSITNERMGTNKGCDRLPEWSNVIIACDTLAHQ